tara:strand:+ start:258 stop:989 length:732 start_codon:yes stop_codon:yes gene_type:complete
MKQTLLQMTQSILSDMDSEAVNSISDTVEAQQIASVIEDTFYNISSARDIPEHHQLLKLTSLSTTAKPTHFQYPTNTKEIVSLRYNVATTGYSYIDIFYKHPLDFINSMNYATTGVTVVADVAGGTDLFIDNTAMPSYYTSFDDLHIVMNSFDSSVETILSASKTQAYGTIYPTFSQTDSFEPDLDDTLIPYLLAEAKSTCFSLFKSGADPKIEQAAKRLKTFVQNDMYKTKQAPQRPSYGRS